MINEINIRILIKEIKNPFQLLGRDYILNGIRL